MTCARCSGLMVIEPFYNGTGSTISGEPQVARCLNCGNVEDAVIHTNRAGSRSLGAPARHNAGMAVVVVAARSG